MGESFSVMPTAAEAVAPTSSWPSPPMLYLPAASGIVNARARSTSGTHFCTVSMRPNDDLNEVVRMARNASMGEWPRAAMTMPETTKASSTARA